MFGSISCRAAVECHGNSLRLSIRTQARKAEVWVRLHVIEASDVAVIIAYFLSHFHQLAFVDPYASSFSVEMEDFDLFFCFLFSLSLLETAKMMNVSLFLQSIHCIARKRKSYSSRQLPAIQRNLSTLNRSNLDIYLSHSHFQ